MPKLSRFRRLWAPLVAGCSAMGGHIGAAIDIGVIGTGAFVAYLIASNPHPIQ